MRHGTLRLSMGLALLAGPAASPAGGDQPTTAEVQVRANAFQPRQVSVSPGGTVTWQVAEGGHTIVADDGSFDFRGDDGTGLPPGEVVTVDVGPDERLLRYHCSIHGGPGGQGMAGVVVVGDPRPPTSTRPVVEVPGDVETLAQAVAVVPPGGTIHLAQGVHEVTDPVVVDRDDVTVQGAPGTRPRDVVLQAVATSSGLPDAVLVLGAERTTLSALTVLAADDAGVVVRGSGSLVRDVRVLGQDVATTGILVDRARGAGLHHVTAHGFRRAGIEVRPCVACGLLVEDVDLHDNLVGLLVEGTAGVQVRGGTVHGNAAGIVARGTVDRPAGIEVIGTHLEGNHRREDLPSPDDPDRELAVGAGIWLDHVADASVRLATFAEQPHGVAVTGGAHRVRIVGNHFTDHATDLLWDGVGTTTCFDDNDAGTTSPPWLADAHPCRDPGVGVPWPPARGALLLTALGG